MATRISYTGGITAANPAMDGTGTVTTVVTAAAGETHTRSLIFSSLGANDATIGRVWLNNGSSNSVAANNSLLKEFDLPPTNAATKVPNVPVNVPINRTLPAGYKLNVTLHSAVSGGWSVMDDSTDL